MREVKSPKLRPKLSPRWGINALLLLGGLFILGGVLFAGYVVLQGWVIRQDQFLATNKIALLPVPTITPTATPSHTPTPLATPTMTPTPTAPPTPTPLPNPIQVNIPAIGVKSSVISVPLIVDPVTGATEWDVNSLFRQGYRDVVGHLEGTALPGQPGNAVLSGHNYGYGYNGVFVHLGLLKPGDRVTVVNEAGVELVYEVALSERVPWRYKTVDELARHLEYLGPTNDERLTLVSCSGGNAVPFLERIYVVTKPVR